MSFISDLVQETKDMFRNLRENPKEIFNGPGTLGALRQALKYNDWKIRGINDPEKSSHDILLGGWSSGGQRQRSAGRVVGTVAAALAGGSAMSGGEAGAAEGVAAGAETGAGESFGLTGAEGAAEGGVASDFASSAGLESGAGEGFGLTGNEVTGLEASAPSPEAALGNDASWGVNPQAETSVVDPGGAGEFTGADTANQGTSLENWMEPGPANNPPANQPGLIEKTLGWVNEKPINTAITYGAISQGASAMLQSRAAEKKRKEEQEAREYNATIKQRMKMSNRSVGGGGVNINMRPGNVPLRRPDGSLVYPQGVYPPGLINGRMGGVRG